MRIIRAADCKVMPWKNGGGTTTEIAVSPEGASLDNFDWRISMAHVAQDGPFSAFPGIDRTLCVLTGNGIRLAFGDGAAVMLERASGPYFFAADRAVDGELIDGEIDDLNVMSRRGRWQHEVQRFSSPGQQAFAVDTGLVVAFAHQGDWRANGSLLMPGDSAITEASPAHPLHLKGRGDLIVVKLTPAAS